MSTTLIMKIVDDNTGATAIEYGLILALIALAIIGAVQALSDETIEMWTRVATEVTGVIGRNTKTPAVD